jgi:hypothetical protein
VAAPEPVSPGLSQERLEEFRAGWRDRREQRERELSGRREQALAGAHRAAALLREEYGATRVLLYGSLAHGHFHERSDVDLLVWGIPHATFFHAWFEAEGACPGFALSLVQAEGAAEALVTDAERYGIPL